MPGKVLKKLVAIAPVAIEIPKDSFHFDDFETGLRKLRGLNTRFSVQEAATCLDVSYATAHRFLTRAIQAEQIASTGKGRATRYFFKN